MFGIEPGTNFSQVCLDPALRQDTSWDFLVCEGHSGWAAIHVTSSFLYYIAYQQAWLIIASHALWEALEVLLLALFGSYVIFGTSAVSIETIASSLIGDLLISGMLGLALGALLVALFDLPPLNTAWADVAAIGPDVPARVRARLIDKQLGAFLYTSVFGLATLFNTWQRPLPECLQSYPYGCENIGLIVVTGVQCLTLLISRLPALAPWLWPGDERAPPYTYGQIGVMSLVVLVVHAQLFQPWVPFYLGITSGFTQPWFASLVLIAIFGALLLYQKWHVASSWWLLVRLYLAAILRILAIPGHWLAPPPPAPPASHPLPLSQLHMYTEEEEEENQNQTVRGSNSSMFFYE